MSIHEQTATAILAQGALAADGVFLGPALAYVAALALAFVFFPFLDFFIVLSIFSLRLLLLPMTLLKA
ncbi:hypothetical protein C3L33_00123, partial [Rhododendron williamsianum]